MLDGYILIPHTFCLILGTNEHLVQVLPDIWLPALHFDTLLKCLLNPVHKIVFIDLHLFYQLEDKAVINHQERIEQMLLFQFLITIFHRNLFTAVDCLD